MQGANLASAVHPLVRQHATATEALLVCKEVETRAASQERVTSLYKTFHPLPARRHGQDPEVRYAEVRLVESLPPYLPVAEELAEKAGLREPLPRDRHGAAVGFKEEEG